MECNSQSDLVSLRDFNMEEDVEDFLAWVGDSQVAKYTTWNPCAAMEEAKQFLVKMQQAVPPHESWFKAVCLNGKPVGHIKLELRTHENGVRYGRIGYALGREYWRRGITTQAVKQCLKIGCTDLSLESVEALVLPENMSSIKLLEKVGFQRSVSYYEYVNVKGNIQQCLLYTFHGSHVI
ncbi:hypothetical protein SUGI_0645340 [Cryptomeria japonica]|uniref:uncharacterized protein LOC131073055 n=1 Tax=Cryptomeria japonica TaxID=3369 RepID=UPI00241494F6|nr:uncharacterized protein LOC131073055 [Cryptomeria japonica]GLJ32045.1 hypothetical protein SUGI_0645340 [Cryptomeria japonica]